MVAETSRMTKGNLKRRTFALPVGLATMIISGLVLSLIGDGWWNALGWAGMGVPFAIILRIYVSTQSAKN